MPSQWGLVHLFDLCLRFGHVDTALALLSHSVTGCTLEDHHLGALPDARGAIIRDGCWIILCGCTGWKTCSRCCWAFPFENGIWMKDWDAPLFAAANAAQQAAKTPLVRGILEISSRNETLPLAMSDAAAARLLDIAMLCGNVKAAANLAKTWNARPLRRWRVGDLWEDDPDLARWRSRFSAALCAGADFEGVHCHSHRGLIGVGYDVPLLRLLPFAFEPEDWQQLEQVLPSEKNQWPSCDVRLGELFLTDEYREDDLWSVSAQRVQNALRAGWDLKYIWMEFEAAGHWYAAGLLDMAVLCGQPDCASALGSAGVELKEDCLDLHRLAFRTDGLEALWRGPFGLPSTVSFGSASECKSAASAAARAFLMNSFKREGVEKGIALCQVMAQKFRPRHVPLALVHDILGFSMEVPKILDQLDLWDDVKGWMPSPEVAAADDTTSPVNSNIEERSRMDVDGEPGPLGLCEQHAFCVSG